MLAKAGRDFMVCKLATKSELAFMPCAIQSISFRIGPQLEADLVDLPVPQPSLTPAINPYEDKLNLKFMFHGYF